MRSLLPAHLVQDRVEGHSPTSGELRNRTNPGEIDVFRPLGKLSISGSLRVGQGTGFTSRDQLAKLPGLGRWQRLTNGFQELFVAGRIEPQPRQPFFKPAELERRQVLHGLEQGFNGQR